MPEREGFSHFLSCRLDNQTLVFQSVCGMFLSGSQQADKIFFNLSNMIIIPIKLKRNMQDNNKQKTSFMNSIAHNIPIFTFMNGNTS